MHTAALSEVSRVLKEEPDVLVDVVGEVVRKTYRNRGLRLLQTWLRPSRASRELATLRAIAAARIPCTQPLRAQEDRVLGFVRSSTLETTYVPGCRTAKEVLPAVAPAERRTLVAAMARAVAALHRAGVLWCAPMPRNFLVVPPGTPGAPDRVLVADVAPAVRVRGSLYATRLAWIDLYDAVCSPSRARDLSRTERLRWLLAYADGDRSLARSLWRSLARRTRVRHRALRAAVITARPLVLLASRPHPRAAT